MSNAIYELNKTRIYVWMKYNSVEHRTYKWNRFNVVTTVTYKWNKFNCNSTRMYRWNRYNLSTTYRWKRCAASGERTSEVKEIGTGEFATVGYDLSKLQFNDDGLIVLNKLPYKHAMTNPASQFDIRDTTRYWTIFEGYWSDQDLDYQEVTTDFYFMPVSDGDFKFSGLGDGGCIIFRRGGGNFTQVRYSRSPDTSNFTYVTSSNASQYPNGGTSGDYYYFDRETIQSQGSAAGSVTSASSSAYPSNGQSGNYWYVSNGSYLSYSKGSANGSVTSTNKSAYPSNGRHSDGYWYEANGSTTSYSKGTANGSVTSAQQNTYPTDGRHSDGYWYTANGYDSTYSQGTKVGTVNDKTETTYPNNARHTDGFWYVKLI